MHQAVSMARDEMGPDKLAEVVEFHRKVRLTPTLTLTPTPTPTLTPTPTPTLTLTR